MSAHIIFGIGLGEPDDDYFYELEHKISEIDACVVENLPYSVGEEVVLYLKGTEIVADYDSVVTKLPEKFTVDEEKAALFKKQCAELGHPADNACWLLTFCGI